MTLSVTSVDQLAAADVEQMASEIEQLLAEKWPTVELDRGVIHDILIYMGGGVLGAINQAVINDVLEARSLEAIEENAALATAENVDSVLSNHRITRKVGAYATGEVTIAPPTR